MLKVVFTHLYIIVMAMLVVTASNIIAIHYGNDIVASVTHLFNSADDELDEVQDSVNDWNKKILE